MQGIRRPGEGGAESDLETDAALAEAEEAVEVPGGIDAMVDRIMTPINAVLYNAVFYSVPFFGADLKLVVLWLVAGAVFCTFYFGFVNVRGVAQSFRLLRGDYSDPDDHGEVSHFQALTTALSGTVGVGNIGAVPVLIVLGGPGAVFWMIVAGLLGMSSKFAECTLGVKYRNENPDGSVSGGPMYSLKKGLAELGKPGLGKFLGVFFAITVIFGCLGGGNMFQANQAYVQFVAISGGENSFLADKGWLFGLVFAIVVAVVIIGGIKSIAKVTEKVVPFMAVFYLTGAFVVLFMNAERIPAAVSSIFTSAFSPEGVGGGVIGVLILGFQRAAFSNEAGIGSAAIAHSAVRTNEPVTEGLVSLLEPFIDTVVICTITALVILTTVYGDPSVEGPDRRRADLRGHAAQHRLVPDTARPRGRAVRLLDDALVVVLRAEGLDLSVRRVEGVRHQLQADLLPVRHHRLHDPADLGARLLRRDDLRDGDPEHPRHLLPRTDRQARDELLLRTREERRDQELPQVRSDNGLRVVTRRSDRRIAATIGARLAPTRR